LLASAALRAGPVVARMIHVYLPLAVPAVMHQDEGAVYHVMCRGDRREAIFADDRDREMFLGTLGQMCARSGLRVHSYVLMSNHYHLLVETPEPNLVAGMKWFQGTYTQRFNARHPRVVQTYSLRRCHCRGKRPRASRKSAKSGESRRKRGIPAISRTGLRGIPAPTRA